MNNYLDTRVGVYLYGKNKKTGRHYYQLNQKLSKTLREVLASTDFSYRIEAYRACHKQNVKNQIGSFTPSGFYEQTRDKNTEPVPSTGLVQIDIDGKTNTQVTDWPTYRDYLFRTYRSIAVAALSCGGKGLYLLVNTTGWINYERHYYSLVEFFQEKEGLEIDPSVSSPNEIRYLSLPTDVLIREDASVYKQLKEKPRSVFEGITLSGDGEIVHTPAEIKGTMRRVHVLDLITRNLHNGTELDKVKAYLTMICQTHLDPTSHLYGDAEELLRLADDLYRRYADQFNQVLEAGRKARLSGGVRTGGSRKVFIHPAAQERDKRLEEHEKLRISADYVYNRVSYDVIGDRYITDNGEETSPAKEFAHYNVNADTLTYIEKHFFMNAFETGLIPRIHSIKTWAETLPPWDGVDWIKKIASFIPATDPVQAELFLKSWLVRSYIQSVNPEDLNPISVVNRWFLILHQHKEDSGKSSFLQWLSPNLDWVKLSGLEENKDGYSAMAKYMFVLDEELAGLGAFKFHTKFKALISTAKIDVRPPYAKADIKMDRVANFYGSTNNDKIFPATEGNSRFLVIPLRDEVFNWRVYTKEIDKNQMWAQVRYLAGTDYLSTISDEVSSTRELINRDLVKDNEETHIVDNYLESDTTGGVMQTAAIAEFIQSITKSYSRINLNMLGQALRKAYGERINGYTNGRRTRGYPVRFKDLTGVRREGDTPRQPVDQDTPVRAVSGSKIVKRVLKHIKKGP